VWIITAWQSISPEVTVKGFQKCCLSSILDDIDYDKLWNDGKEDGNVRRECEDEDSDTDWERQIESNMCCVLNVEGK